MLRSIAIILATFSFATAMNAQCLWRLDMFDTFGDGWNQGVLTITSGTNTQTFTLNTFPDGNGVDSTAYFQVFPGQPFTVSWTSGFFDNEVVFQIFNSENTLVLNVQQPTAGVIYTGTGVCPSCVLPVNVVTENIYDKRVKIRWTPGIGTSNPVGWWVIYGPEGFAPGTGDTLYLTTPKVTITGLTPKSKYTYYVIQDCGNGDFSNAAGPIDFETYWSNDVAVTGVVTPQSDCELGVEIIRFQMSNPGANPQSLIPYTFYINGQSGGVQQPDDGYYTGVLGKDSTEVIEFETTYDFSDPGEYEIMIFTALPGDEDTANDTLRYFINNVLVAPYAQGFEKWNGGWTVEADLNTFDAPSWEYGVPAGTEIASAGEGQKAWVTNLTGEFNFGERGFIKSTCFDFSELTTDPALECMVNYHSNEFGDAAFVDYSVDNGLTWVRIGTEGTGANWYNAIDPITGQNTSWAGNSDGWVKTHHLIDGAAGESNVIFRFGFFSVFSGTQEGFGVDDFKVFVPEDKDLAAIKVSTLGEAAECGLEQDKVTLNLVNVGATTLAQGYQLGYSVNGGTPVLVSVNNNILSADENQDYTFSATFDSRDVVSVIKCWVVAAGDTNSSNDTVVYTISHLPRVVPFQENFEASANIPAGWTAPGMFITNTNGNTSNVLTYNLYSFNPSFTATTPRFGIIGANDSIRFDYRITNFGSNGTGATVLSLGTKIEVQVSTDCGQNFTTVNTINATNHAPTVNYRTRKISLANYADQNIVIRFVGTWGTGDFYFDMDNIGIISCPADMMLSANVTGTAPGQSTGTASVNVGLGNPPYHYNWSTGATTQSVSGLGEGTYTVSVTDASGCTSALEIGVLTSATNELPGITAMRIFPNPTSGLVQINLNFERSVDLQYAVFNMLGQQIVEENPGNTASASSQLDLSQQTSGIYLLRITADGQSIIKKIIRD